MRKFYFVFIAMLTFASVQANVITGNFSICLPGPTTTQLSASAPPAPITATTPWVSSNPAVATIDSSGLVTAVSYGATTITYTDNLGYLYSENVYVSRFPTISAPNGTSTCQDGTLQLEGSLFPNATNPWESLNPSIATIDNTGFVTGVSAGVVNILYRNLGGCTTTIPITINPLLIPTITCGLTTSSSMTFNWSPVPGALTYVVYYTINGGSFNSAGSAQTLTYTFGALSPGDKVNIYVAPSGPVGSCFTIGSASCFTNTNCDGSNTPAPPVVILTEPTCNNSTGSIAIVAVAGNTFSLDGGAYTTTLLYSGLLAGSTHSVTAKNAAGCISNATVVTIGNQPTNPTATLTLTSSIGSTSQIVCLNTSITPVVFTTGGGAIGASIVSGSLPLGLNAVFSSGVLTISGIALEAGTFNYIAATTGGCGTASKSGVITILPETTLTLTSSPVSTSQELCLHTPILPISYAVGSGGNGASVTGLPLGISGTFDSGVFTISGTSTQTGTFPFTVMTTGGCGTATKSGVIIVNPLLELLFCDASQTTAPNSVYFDWQTIPGVTSYDYSYTIAGGALVTGTTSVSHYEVFNVLPGQEVSFTVANNQTACGSSVTTTCMTLSNDDFQTDAFQYFPNPVDDFLNLKFSKPIKSVQIFNILGQQVFSRTYNEKDIQINLALLSQGTYLVKAYLEDLIKTFKIVKN